MGCVENVVPVAGRWAVDLAFAVGVGIVWASLPGDDYVAAVLQVVADYALVHRVDTVDSLFLGAVGGSLHVVAVVAVDTGADIPVHIHGHGTAGSDLALDDGTAADGPLCHDAAVGVGSTWACVHNLAADSLTAGAVDHS